MSQQESSEPAIASPAIVVVGSFVIDLVFKAPRRPQAGESLIGTEFGIFTGGKGMNQALAAARAGGKVSMVGRLGQDYFGDQFMSVMQEAEMDARFVQRDPHIGTGVASPVIEPGGENSIIVVPRANLALSRADVDAAEEVLRQAAVLLLQLEIPLDTSQYAASRARQAGAIIVLNSAPAAPLPNDLLALVDVLICNETEAELLTGISPCDTTSATAAGQALRARGCKVVILTLGAAGALLVTAEESCQIGGYRVTAVDTTGAGDAFCGNLAVALARGEKLAEAVAWANAAGALACTVLGAGPSMPLASSVTTFLRDNAPHSEIMM